MQRFREDDVRVLELDHDIPICESVSPVSSDRWHAMGADEVDAYRARLTREVSTWMDEIEDASGETFTLAIAHHTFMNTVVMRDAVRMRRDAGRPRCRSPPSRTAPSSRCSTASRPATIRHTRGPGAARYARDRFSVVRQVSDLLAEVDRRTAG